MPITVRELVEILAAVDDQDRIVVMSSDSEGNSYSPLAQIGTEASYSADTTWGGEIGPDKLTPELVKEGYTEDDIVDGVPAVVLWPTM